MLTMTLQDIIDLLKADRPRWKPGLLTWKASFASVPTETLHLAALAFLEHGKGNPDTHKIWAEIRKIQAVVKPTLPAWSSGPSKSEIQAELDERGDPVADWLEMRGEPTVRKPKPR